MSDSEFEYIVVGSGAGGGTLAARLAEAGRTVLLLEAGGKDQPFNYQVPCFHGSATEDASMRLDHYVRHYLDEDRQEKDPKYLRERNAGRDGVYYPRARTLGGCTAHYAMIIIRPHDSDWRGIQEATWDGGWGPRGMGKELSRLGRRAQTFAPSSGHRKGGLVPSRLSG